MPDGGIFRCEMLENDWVNMICDNPIDAMTKPLYIFVFAAGTILVLMRGLLIIGLCTVIDALQRVH